MFLVRKSSYMKLMDKYEQASRDLSRLYEENERLRELVEDWRKQRLLHERHLKSAASQQSADPSDAHIVDTKSGNSAGRQSAAAGLPLLAHSAGSSWDAVPQGSPMPLGTGTKSV